MEPDHNFGFKVSLILAYIYSIFAKSDVPLHWLFLYFLYKATTHAPPRPKLCCKAYFRLGTYLNN